MGARIPESQRRQSELSGNRLIRWPQANHRKNPWFCGERYALDGDCIIQGRSASVSDHRRRRCTGGECSWYPARRNGSERSGIRRYLSGQNHKMERPRNHQTQSGAAHTRPAARSHDCRGAARGRLGTSALWTHYLSQTNAQWKKTVGEGATVSWPAGIGGKGNDGVAAFVGRLKGAIGYIEWSYAKQNKISYVRLRNPEGAIVAP